MVVWMVVVVMVVLLPVVVLVRAAGGGRSCCRGEVLRLVRRVGRSAVGSAAADRVGAAATRAARSAVAAPAPAVSNVRGHEDGPQALRRGLHARLRLARLHAQAWCKTRAIDMHPTVTLRTRTSPTLHATPCPACHPQHYRRRYVSRSHTRVCTRDQGRTCAASSAPSCCRITPAHTATSVTGGTVPRWGGGVKRAEQDSV